MPPKRMTANPVRPARYRPGKPIGPDPGESSEEEEEEEEEEDEVEEEQPKAPKPQTARVSAALKKVDLNKRFEQSRRAEEARKAAEESSEGEEESGDEEEEQGGEGRGDKKDDGDEDDESSEYTSDEEDSEPEAPQPKPVFLRPTFIPKSKRIGNAVAPIASDSSLTAAAAAVAEEAAIKLKAEEAERRKIEAQELVEEHLRKEAAEREASRKAGDDDFANDASQVDDTDDLDPEAERAAWKLRELLRVKRERDELEKVEKEREEIERRRNMDENERIKEDMEFVRKQRAEAKEARGEMKFMQKYYHKGAFYQDDSEILKRNYATAPVEDQAANKEILPKHLQVRGEEQGLRGKTKWTHLQAEDTSRLEGGSPWFDKKFSGNMTSKLGGLKDQRYLPDSTRPDRRHGEGSGSFRRREEDGDNKADWRGKRNNTFGDDKRPPEGPRAMRDHDRGRHNDDRYQPDRSRHGRDRSRSQEDRRHRERERSNQRGGYRERDYHRDRGYDRDTHRRRDSRDRNRGDDRKRGQDEGGEIHDKRRKLATD